MNKRPITKNEICNILKKLKRFNLGAEVISLSNSENRILADSVLSKINHPPFKNSAVDGYALNDKDINKNGNKKISYRIAAGDSHRVKLKTGEVARIFTGGKMPLNSSTVVMQENVQKINSSIKIIKNPKIGENCRLEGQSSNDYGLLQKLPGDCRK